MNKTALRLVIVTAILMPTATLATNHLMEGSQSAAMADCSVNQVSASVADTIGKDNVKTHILQETEVVAERVTRENGQLTIRPSKNQKNHAQTGYALLYNILIPGLIIQEDGSVNSLGIPATLYINGQPADMQDILYIQPQEVTKIEYIDVPTGKYAKDQLAINFVVMQLKHGGYLHLSASQTIGINSGEYGVNSSFNKGSMSYSIIGGYTYSSINNTNSITKETYNLADIPVTRDLSHTQNIKNNNAYAHLKIKYQTDKQYITGKITFVSDDMPLNESSGLVYSGFQRQNNPYQTATTSSSLSPKLDFNGEFTFGERHSLSFGIHGKYFRNKYNRIYLEDNFSSNANDTEDVSQINGGIIYTLKHSKGVFSAELFDYYDNYSAIYNGTYNSKSNLWKNNFLAFVSNSFNFNDKTSLQARLGVDWNQYKLNDTYRYNELNPRISLRFSRNTGNGMFTLYGMLANSTYGMDVINNAVIKINPYLTRIGNPDMKKSHYLNSYAQYSIQISKINLTALAQYAYTHNPVTCHYYQQDNHIIQSFSNIGHNQYISGIIAATYSPSRFFAISGDIRLNYTEIETGENWNSTDITGNIGAQFYIKNFAIMPYINFQQKKLDRFSTNMITTPINYSIRVSYSYKNLLASCDLVSPFSKLKVTTITDTEAYKFHNQTWNHANYKYCKITLSYLFNFGRSIQKNEDKIDKTINSSLLKEFSL